MSKQEILRNVIASSKRLAEMDPQDEAIKGTVEQLERSIGLLSEDAKAEPKDSWGEHSMKKDMEFLGEQIKKLKAAAVTPARNYTRIVNITDGLHNAFVAAQKPQNAKMRPHLVSIVKKVAGIFAEVDTVEDLDKPLEDIEKAVHKLYGDQSSNACYYFERRSRGHHGEGS
jgi:hypothetical protein